MVKNAKKRSVSESEVAVKVGQELNNVNKAQKKKKTENVAAQNGQTNKEVRNNASKKLNEKKNVQGSPDNDKKAQLIKRREAYREKRKLQRKSDTPYGLKPDASAEVIKEKIEKIEKRAELTKSAKRKLAALRKLLKVKQGKNVATQQVAKQQPGKVKNDKSVEAAKKKQVQTNEEQKKKLLEKGEAKSNKDNKKKDVKQGALLLLKQKAEAEDEEDDEDDDEDEIEMDDNVSEDEDEDDSVLEEEEDDDEDMEEEEEEDEEDDEDEEEEDEDEDDKAKTNNIQSPKVTGKPQQNKEQEGKKKKYVLFVGNLPFNITEEELKKHFLTKVSQVVDIRIPKRDNTNVSRGFAYVELGNNTDYEKALSLNQSAIQGRRMNVRHFDKDRKEPVAKSHKLQPFQKAGKFAGGQNKKNQRNAGRQWKQNMQKTKT